MWFHYYFLPEPQFWHLNRNSDIWRRPSKMATFKAQKKLIWGPKKRHSRNPCWHGLFAKKRVQFGLIWPPWPHLYFTPAYRGFPPCTLSQHPDTRGTGYSNVLGNTLLSEIPVSWFQVDQGWRRWENCACLFFCKSGRRHIQREGRSVQLVSPIFKNGHMVSTHSSHFLV